MIEAPSYPLILSVKVSTGLPSSLVRRVQSTQPPKSPRHYLLDGEGGVDGGNATMGTLSESQVVAYGGSPQEQIREGAVEAIRRHPGTDKAEERQHLQ